MRLRPVRVVTMVLAAGLVAVAAGCGGGGSGKGSISVSVETSAPTTEAATTSGGSGAAPKFATAKNCQDLAGLAAKVASAIAASAGNPATTLETEAKQLQGLANAAPPDVRGDFQTFASAFSHYLGTIEKAGFKPGSTTKPTAAQIAALTKAAKSLDTPKLRKAEQHLTTWAQQNCKGINLGG